METSLTGPSSWGVWIGYDRSALITAVLVCSLLCAAAVLFRKGCVLQRAGVMVLCQLYFVLTACFLLLLGLNNPAALMSGLLLLLLTVAALCLRKRNFPISRCCVAVSAVMAVASILLLA